MAGRGCHTFEVLGRRAVQLVVVGLLVLSTLGSRVGYGQSPNGRSTPVQRGRINLAEEDWQDRAKTATGLRFDDAVRLRPGVTTGRITLDPIPLPFAVNAIGPHWNAAVPDGANVEIALRTRTDDGSWSSWTSPMHPSTIPATGEDGQAKNAFAGDVAGGLLLARPDTRSVQVRVILQGTVGTTPALHRLSLYFVNSTEGPAPPDDVRDRMRWMGSEPDTSKPRIFTRSEWGAAAPTAAYQYHPVTHLAIHHTATTSAGAADMWEDCAAAVRAIQDYHQNTRGWIDIGYNYLICQTGAIFQGREDANDDRDVVAAHDGYNEGSAGTGALGYFHPPENQEPKSPLLDGFTDLFAWIAAERGIDPEGTSTYFEYGPLQNVYGHRDVKATACPGDHLYSERRTIINRLDELVPVLPPKPTLSKNAPNPVSDVTHFDLEVARSTPVRLTVYDLLGRRVAHRQYGMLPAGTHTVTVATGTWASGTYPYRFTVGERTQTGTIQVVR